MENIYINAFKEFKLLNESENFNIADKNDQEKLKDFLDDGFNDNVEMIVDVKAESEDELKDSYIDNIILECPVCKHKIYKDPSEIRYGEDGSTELVNIGEACDECKCEDGWKIIGKVGAYVAGDEKTENDTATEVKEESDDLDLEPISDEDIEITADTEEENVEESLNKNKTASLREAKMKTKTIQLENFDENSFDTLVTKYLNEVYENVKDYKTTKADLDDNSNSIYLEGLITFGSGKQKNTKFTFKSHAMTESGKIRFFGLNEMLSSGKKSFSLVGKVNNDKLISESLSYRYTHKNKSLTESKKIHGRVVLSK